MPSSTGRTLIAVSAIAMLALAGCSTVPASTAADEPAVSVAALGEGFLGDAGTPSPGATIVPETGSWNGVTPPAGYRAILLATDGDPASDAVTASVEDWAERSGVELTVMTATDTIDMDDRFDEAVAATPDLVIGAGGGAVDTFAYLTSQSLAQQFLVVGAQLAEPTDNVTAVIWPGATFRGTNLGEPETDAEGASEYASDAVDAGVASIVNGLTGIVIELQ